MCGLVGIAGKLEYKDEATMKRLLIYDYFRGTDSTGLAAIRNDGQTRLAKIASHPLDLFDMKTFSEALSGLNSMAFIGHNRAATKGAVNRLNAHPFECGHIVGAHNGTLTMESWKALEEKIGEKTDVDSIAIFKCIEMFGIEETVKLLQGAWALVWYDMTGGQKGTLNFLRNKERPFWYAYDKEFKKVFWASEWPMIDAATRMAAPSSYEMYTEPEKGHRFWGTKEDWLYTYDLEKLKQGYDSKPIVKVKELKGKEAPPAVTNYACGVDPFERRQNLLSGTTHTPTGGTSGWRQQGNRTNSTTNSHSSNIHELFKKERSAPQALHFIGTTIDPFAGHISKEKFEELARHGCSFCQEDVKWGDIGLTIYEQGGQVLCPSCSCKPDQTTIFVTSEKMNAA